MPAVDESTYRDKKARPQRKHWDEWFYQSWGALSSEKHWVVAFGGLNARQQHQKIVRAYNPHAERWTTYRDVLVKPSSPSSPSSSSPSSSSSSTPSSLYGAHWPHARSSCTLTFVPWHGSGVVSRRSTRSRRRHHHHQEEEDTPPTWATAMQSSDTSTMTTTIKDWTESLYCGRLILFGGMNGESRFNDVWSLTLSLQHIGAGKCPMLVVSQWTLVSNVGFSLMERKRGGSRRRPNRKSKGRRGKNNNDKNEEVVHSREHDYEKDDDTEETGFAYYEDDERSDATADDYYGSGGDTTHRRSRKKSQSFGRSHSSRKHMSSFMPASTGGNDAPPSARNGHSAVTLNALRDVCECCPRRHANPFAVVVYGGFDGQRLNDTHALHVDDEHVAHWTRLPDGPSARSEHSAVVHCAADRSFMYVFGGNADHYTNDLANDVFRFNAWTHEWEGVHTFGTPPRARRSHAACVVGNYMFIHGGVGGASASDRLGDLWRLDLTSFCWQQVSVTANPSKAVQYIANKPFKASHQGEAQGEPPGDNTASDPAPGRRSEDNKTSADNDDEALLASPLACLDLPRGFHALLAINCDTLLLCGGFHRLIASRAVQLPLLTESGTRQKPATLLPPPEDALLVKTQYVTSGESRQQAQHEVCNLFGEDGERIRINKLPRAVKYGKRCVSCGKRRASTAMSRVQAWRGRAGGAAGHATGTPERHGLKCRFCGAFHCRDCFRATTKTSQQDGRVCLDCIQWRAMAVTYTAGSVKTVTTSLYNPFADADSAPFLTVTTRDNQQEENAFRNEDMLGDVEMREVKRVTRTTSPKQRRDASTSDEEVDRDALSGMAFAAASSLPASLSSSSSSSSSSCGSNTSGPLFLRDEEAAGGPRLGKEHEDEDDSDPIALMGVASEVDSASVGGAGRYVGWETNAQHHTGGGKVDTWARATGDAAMKSTAGDASSSASKSRKKRKVRSGTTSTHSARQSEDVVAEADPAAAVGLAHTPSTSTSSVAGVVRHTRASDEPLSFVDRMMSQFSIQDVGDWLRYVGLGEHVDTFAKNGVDGLVLGAVRETQLKSLLRMDKASHRASFLAARRALLRHRPPVQPTWDSNVVPYWSPSRVGQWLSSLQLAELIPMVERHAVNGSLLLRLDDAMLQYCGVEDELKRLKVVVHCKALRDSEDIALWNEPGDEQLFLMSGPSATVSAAAVSSSVSSASQQKRSRRKKKARGRRPRST